MGNVRLKATFCYASPTDPQDAAAYTKAGLEVVFRPNDEKVKDGKSNADTKGFFDLKKFATEQERRSDQGKWETVLHGAKTFRGSSLKNQCSTFTTTHATAVAGPQIVPKRSAMH